MLTGDCIPRSRSEEPVALAIREMEAKKLGTTLVVDRRNILAGIVTDGDLRRALARFGQILERQVKEVMTTNPQAVGPETLASQALELMEQKAIMVLPVVDDEGKVLGIVHLHDLLGRGEFKFTA